MGTCSECGPCGPLGLPSSTPTHPGATGLGMGTGSARREHAELLAPAMGM